MAAKTKKVILFIVEGPTDEDTLSPILKAIFQNIQVRFHVVHGDITSSLSVENQNAVNTVNEHIKKEMNRYGFTRKDVMHVIHLIDTDGAFIPNECVIADDAVRLCYENNRIITRSVEKTIERNERKQRVVHRLYPAKKIGGIPYTLYYFSRNLEHVFHNNSHDLTDEQKADRADLFADTYANNPNGFIRFLTDSEFAVQGEYEDTWDYIFEGTHSLQRHCNLQLLFTMEEYIEVQSCIDH